MDAGGSRELRSALTLFIERSDTMAWMLFLANLALYAALIAIAVFAAPLWLRLPAALLAGAAISALFVIGHDAAHGAYTGHRRINGLIGRIAFLPSLHNFSLWQVAHNRLHHRHTNLKGANSWSPLSRAEFERLPGWRKSLYRLYRSPLGFAPYYVIERWWQDKFFPRARLLARIGGEQRGMFQLDFLLLAGFLTIFSMLLVLADGWAGLFWGFALPFLVFGALMGATTYLQHTDRRVPWFETQAEWRDLAAQEEISVHLLVPRWYGLISHHIMDHPAHHLQPKIPLYRLPAAQARLNALIGERAVIERFSLGYLLDTMRACKLYDYETHCWLDFAGQPTSQRNLPSLLLTQSLAIAA